MFRIFSLFLSAFLSTAVFSQEITQTRFEFITVDNGLSQNTVETIFQDSQGYIWIGTQNGLNKYNGIDFQVFFQERGDSNSLASSWVNAIAEDKDGNIWIGSDGLNIYNPRQDKMLRIDEDPQSETSFHGGKVYGITVDPDNNIWIATSKGVAHYTSVTKTFTTYQSSDTDGSLKGNNFFSVLITRENRIFIASDSDPVYEFIPTSKTFIEHNYKQKYFNANFKKSIAEDENGLLYIAAEGSALHTYNPKTKYSELIDVSPEGLNAATIKAKVLPLSSTEVYIGTDGGGINIYNPETRSFKYYINDAMDPYSLGGNTIFCMYKDNHGNIWVGHYGAGISLIKSHKFKFVSFFHNPFIPGTLSKGVVTAVYEDSQKRIWVGIDGGGLNQFNLNDLSFKTYRHKQGDPSTLTTDVIVAISETRDGKLLLGTYGGGLMVFDPQRGLVIKDFQVETGLSAAHVWDITEDDNENFWVSTLGGGYDIWNPNTNEISNHVFGRDPSACSDVILSINKGPDGNMWFATEASGICVISPEQELVKKYSVSEGQFNSLSSNDIRGIVFSENLVWVLTNGGGLNRIDMLTDSVKVYTTADGLSSNSLMGALVDDQGFLWLSSAKGIMKFNPQTGMTISFDKSQGLQGNEFRYNAQYKLSDGKLLFGGANGLTLFNPRDIRLSPIQPPLVFTRLLISNQPAQIGAKGSPLKEHINYTSEFKLKYNQNVITIDFASLDFTSPEKNQFRYMMEGIDDDWVHAGTRNSITYTNLPAGKYLLKVKCSNSDGVWNDLERSIRIHMRPPWYKTKLFILLAILTFIFLLVGYIKRREALAKLEKEILQKKIDEGQMIINEKLAEVEKQKEEIRKKDELEKEIRFQTEGLAKFSFIIAKNRNNLRTLAQNIISELVSYTSTQAGALYVADKNENNEIFLTIYGQYCYDGVSLSKEQIIPGEGYVGTAFNQKLPVILENLPEGFIILKSGLGSISAKYCLVHPIIDEDIAMGAFEIASLEKLPEYKVEFIEKIVHNFASVLAIEQINDKSKILLEENIKKTEEILSHEEEMRQNMEELQATQEMSVRREEELVLELKQKEELIHNLQERISGNKKS